MSDSASASNPSTNENPTLNHLTDEQVRKYLEVLGLDVESVLAAPRDKSLLDELVDAHQTHVPFQTISINMKEEQPSLDMDDLYEKIVVNEWGGFCFELNKLFEELLRSLGFDVRPIFSRSVRGRDVRMPINHRAMLVTIDGLPMYADVGFGGPTPSGALVLEDGVEQSFESGEFIPVSVGDGHWRVDRITRGSRDSFDDAVAPKTQTEIELYEYPVEDIDFELLNKALSSPGSLFRDTAIVNLRTPDGHRSLRDSTLTLRKNCEKQIVELTESEFPGALSEYFGLREII